MASLVSEISKCCLNMAKSSGATGVACCLGMWAKMLKRLRLVNTNSKELKASCLSPAGNATILQMPHNSQWIMGLWMSKLGILHRRHMRWCCLDWTKISLESRISHCKRGEMLTTNLCQLSLFGGLLLPPAPGTLEGNWAVWPWTLYQAWRKWPQIATRQRGFVFAFLTLKLSTASIVIVCATPAACLAQPPAPFCLCRSICLRKPSVARAGMLFEWRQWPHSPWWFFKASTRLWRQSPFTSTPKSSW